MAGLPIREDRTCLNCGHIVEDVFCSHCGQKNIVNRPSAFYLFKSSLSTIFHMDGNLIRTLKVLIFKPGKIVNDYLSGKRKSYIPPVRLYIFASFIFFFLSFLSSGNDSDIIGENNRVSSAEMKELVAAKENLKEIQKEKLEKGDEFSAQILEEAIGKIDTKLDSIKPTQESAEDKKSAPVVIDFKRKDESKIDIGKYEGAETVATFDSIHNSLSKKDRMNWAGAKVMRKLISINERANTKNENIQVLFMQKLESNTPKLFFIFLPVFAFFLWLFYNKKKWKYYDHAIFTLFLFSFIFVTITTLEILDSLSNAVTKLFPQTESVTSFLADVLNWGSLLFIIIYTILAFKRVYKQRWRTTGVKLIALSVVNFFTFIIFGTLYIFFTLMIL